MKNWLDQPLDREAAEDRAEFERRIAWSNVRLQLANDTQSNLFNPKNSYRLSDHAKLNTLLNFYVLGLYYRFRNVLELTWAVVRAIAWCAGNPTFRLLLSRFL